MNCDITTHFIIYRVEESKEVLTLIQMYFPFYGLSIWTACRSCVNRFILYIRTSVEDVFVHFQMYVQFNCIAFTHIFRYAYKVFLIESQYV